MTRQVLFVHGAGEGAHAEDSKLVASLEQQLGTDYRIHYPKMPNEAEPDYTPWKQRIAEELATMGDGAILVGHSFGASVAIKQLVEPDFKASLAALFLIAAPFWHEDFWRWDAMYLPAEVATLVPRGLPVFLYHGRADEIVPFDHLEMYARTLPQAVVRRLDDRNHQLNDDLSEVAIDIRQLR